MVGSSESRGTNKNHEKDEEETEDKNDNTTIKKSRQGEEVKGSLTSSPSEKRLMRTVMENDKKLIEDSLVIAEGVAQGVQTFTPDLFFEQLVKRYKETKKIFGERLIKALTGYEPGYVERNIRIPEFKRELKEKINEKITSLQKKGFINKEGEITETGITIASILMVQEELNKLRTKGLIGERGLKTRSKEGETKEKRPLRDGDPYRNLSIRDSIRKAIKRGRKEVLPEDLVIKEKEDKQRATIIYALDTSGSMKGNKLAAAKKAGLALAYKAITKNDKVGIIIFGKTIEEKQEPTNNFTEIIKKVSRTRASNQTNLALAIKEATKTFNQTKSQTIKHLLLLTDCLHTTGTEEEVIKAASQAASEGITISVIGLGIDEEGKKLGQKIVDIGKGSLKLVKDYEDLDLLVLEDYYNSRKKSL